MLYLKEFTSIKYEQRWRGIGFHKHIAIAYANFLDLLLSVKLLQFHIIQIVNWKDNNIYLRKLYGVYIAKPVRESHEINSSVCIYWKP